MDERTALAYHESGHAVVGHRLGHKLVEVRIKPEPKAVFAESISDMEHSLAVGAAGYLSVEKFLGVGTAKKFEASLRRAAFDTSAAMAELAKLPDKSLKKQTVTRNAQSFAESFLDANEPAVRALAEALLERDELTADEAVRIMDAA